MRGVFLFKGKIWVYNFNHMNQTLYKAWRFVRIPLYVALALYAALVIYRIPAVGEKERADIAIAHINAQKLTLSDVMGKVLPPVPNMEENNATVEGIDVNNNGVRDDVELAIFEKYPHSAKMRSAELQFAMALQMEMTYVFNKDTWEVAANQMARGYQCVGDLSPRTNLVEHGKMTEKHTKEVMDLVFNTQRRKDTYEDLQKNITSFGNVVLPVCDVDPDSLPN